MPSSQHLNALRLFIGNFPFSTTESELFQFLSRWVTVTAVKVVYNENGRSKGYAFCDFADETDRGRALELNGYDFRGRPLRVQPVRAR